jgi:hypothetical protein
MGKNKVPKGAVGIKDPDQFDPAEVAVLLRRVAPAQTHELRRQCLKTADFLDGVEVPGIDNPVVIAIPIRHEGEYVGWLQTVANTYVNSDHKMNIHAETVFIAMDQREREEYNAD